MKIDTLPSLLLHVVYNLSSLHLPYCKSQLVENMRLITDMFVKQYNKYDKNSSLL